MRLSLLSLFCFLVSVNVVRGALYTALFPDGIIDQVASIDLEFGSFTTITDLKSFADQFNTLLSITAYDSMSDLFILGNANPPLLLLANCFTKQASILKLPEYGSLLSFTAYDAYIYTLIGADPDVPSLGHLVAVNTKTNDATRLTKIKIADTENFLIGGPLTFLSAYNAWLFEITNSNIIMVTVSGNTSQIIDTKIPGGYTTYWNDVNYSNITILAYGNDKAVWIDVLTGAVKPFVKYNCSGIFTADFVNQNTYFFSRTCGDGPQIETISFSNRTSTVNLDKNLASVIGINSNTPYIPFLCGSKCSVNTDCYKAKTCNTCRAGRCVSPGSCGDYCQNPSDCFAGVCVGDCELNRCGRRGCGSRCDNHDDCALHSKDCTVCRLGRCVDFGGCGAYCLTPDDCYAGQCTSSCISFQCLKLD